MVGYKQKESVEPQYLKISGLVQSNFYRINQTKPLFYNGITISQPKISFNSFQVFSGYMGTFTGIYIPLHRD